MKSYKRDSRGSRNFDLIIGLFFISCIPFLTDCNQTFEPIQENDRYHFSIYGTLDAAADTQWIRVGTVRQNIDEAPDPTGIKVTLEHIQSGQTFLMNDSLFTSKNVLNYWTTTDIENEQTYRITVEQADGKASSVTVTTPKQLPSPYIIFTQDPNGVNIYVDDIVEHLADLQSVWYITLNPETEPRKRIYRFPIRNTLRNTYSFYGAYSAFSNWEEQLGQIEQSIGQADYSIERALVFIAAGGPEWDESFTSIDDLEYFLDGTASNVENGLGYVVGIDGRWFRQTTCLTADSSAYAPCTPQDGPFW